MTIRELWEQTADLLDDRPAARWLCEVATSVARRRVHGGARRTGDAADGRPSRLHARTAPNRRAVAVRARPLGVPQLDLAVDRRVLIPRPETELVAGAAIALARACGSPRHRRRSRHRLGCDRTVARRRAAARRAPRCGSPTSTPMRSTSHAPTSPGSGGRPSTSAWRTGRGSRRCPATPVRRDRAQPALRRRRLEPVEDSVREWEPAPRAVRRGRRARRHPHLVDGAPTHLRAGWMAGARDRRRPGPRGVRAVRRRPATPTSRSDPTSPATTASPSAAPPPKPPVCVTATGDLRRCR